MDAGPARILLVGEDSLARGGLATSLEQEGAIAVVGQVTPSEDVAAESARLGANVILWDAGLDFSTHLDRLRDVLPLPAEVALIASGERGASDAYSLGVRGFFLRGADPHRLSASLVAIERGAAVLDELIAGSLFSPPRAPLGDVPVAPRESPLTPREQEVLSLISEGLSNKGIASRLGISENTAKFHVNAILNKLGAETRTEAVVLGARLGLLVL